MEEEPTGAATSCFPFLLMSRRGRKHDDSADDEESFIPIGRKNNLDVLGEMRKIGIEPLVARHPLSQAQPYRYGETYIDVNKYKVSINKHSERGQPLYSRFEKALKKTNNPQSYTLLFHGTSCKAAQAIAKNGIDPKLRVSSSRDWFRHDINYALT